MPNRRAFYETPSRRVTFATQSQWPQLGAPPPCGADDGARWQCAAQHGGVGDRHDRLARQVGRERRASPPPSTSVRGCSGVGCPVGSPPPAVARRPRPGRERLGNRRNPPHSTVTTRYTVQTLRVVQAGPSVSPRTFATKKSRVQVPSPPHRRRNHNVRPGQRSLLVSDRSATQGTAFEPGPRTPTRRSRASAEVPMGAGLLGRASAIRCSHSVRSKEAGWQVGTGRLVRLQR
jgi:hypothetical protein